MLCIANMQVSDSSRAMRSFREKLPAFKVKSEFLKAVAENQVWYSVCIKMKIFIDHDLSI